MPTDPEPSLLDTGHGQVGITREGDPTLQAILCVHGIPGSTRDFRHLSPLLSERFHIVRLDMPGFGSAPPGQVRSVEGWARVLIAVAEELKLEHPLLMSHSFGGTTVLRANALAPGRFAGLVLLASPGPRRHRAYNLPPAAVRAFAWLAARWPFQRPLCALSRRLYARMGLHLPDDDDRVQNLMRVVGSLDFEAVGRDARAADLPVLLAHCADDPMVERAISDELAALLPQVTRLGFDEGGHHLQKTQAEPIAAAIRQLPTLMCRIDSGGGGTGGSRGGGHRPRTGGNHRPG